MKRYAVGVLNGNWKNRWKDESSDRRSFIIEQNKLDFGDALDALKAADPQWEAWFDDDENIPPYISWLETGTIKKLCERMKARAEWITHESQNPKNQETPADSPRP